MDVHRLLAQWDIRPGKGLGQNFLLDQAILDRIIAAAELTPTDVVLEIGAGLGTLTRRLAGAAGQVVAVELDRRLMPVLHNELAAFKNITLVQGDILTLDPAALVSVPCYHVVANLPYYITSAVLRHLLETSRKPQRMVLTVQREVAERITAGPGKMSLLAVSVQFYARPRLLFRIKPGSFYPSPEVESAVVRLDLYTTPPVAVEDEATFFRIARAGFAQRRKQLGNALAAGLGCPLEEITARLREAGVDPRRRAETLGLAEWAAVARTLGAGLPRL